MPGPWEKYQSTADSSAEKKPWEKYGNIVEPEPTPAPSKSPGFFSRMNEDLVRRGVNISDELKPKSAESIGQTLKQAPERALRITGQATGLINDAAGEALKSVYKTIMPNATQDAIESAVKRTVNDPKFKPFIEGVSHAVNTFKKNNPNLSKDIEAGVNIATVFPVTEAAKKGILGLGESPEFATAAANAAKSGITSDILGRTSSQLDKKLDATITRGIEKAIRPSVSGKETIGQANQYFHNARKAVKTIIQNSPNLRLTDEFGDEVSGLPKTLKQFGQAIAQTKNAIFKRYNAMAKEAGAEGAKIQLAPIAKELNSITKSKPLRDLSPATIGYARARAESLMKRKLYTPEDTQEAIKILNNSLESFYKNPSYDTASKAYIDSMIVNHLRKGMDEAIENASFSPYVTEKYGDLKKTYGALKSIERDVNKRAIVAGRQNPRGLLDFSDIFSGSEVVRGLVSMNPASVGTGVAAWIIKSLEKKMNYPNRIVKNLFEDSEQLIKKSGFAKQIEKSRMDNFYKKPLSSFNIPSDSAAFQTE